MRFKTLIFILILLLTRPAGAQDSDFPTLDALASLEIPAYLYVDTTRRLSWIDTNHIPPSSPPIYAIGDRESFMVRVNDDGREEAEPTVLRGQTENVLIWVQESAAYSRAKAQAMAELVETDILAPLQQLTNYSEPPGVDGDPRLTIVMTHNPANSLRAYFPPSHLLPRTLFPASNLREMLIINLANDDGSFISDNLIREIIAHEYQHILMHHRDENEDRWLDEALAGFSEFYITGSENVNRQAERLAEAPNTGLTHFYLGENLPAKYAAGALFTIFVAEQYGDEVISRLMADSADGWNSIEKVLRESAGVSADEVFADWVLAKYFHDSDRGFGYQNIEPPPNPPQPVATFRDFPALHSGSLPQYSTDYFVANVRGAHKLSLRLTQAPEAHLINTAPYEGGFFSYAFTRRSSNSRLTRAIDLNTYRRAWLEFQIWHDLAEHYEYAYVEISTNGGVNWDILPGEHTSGDSLLRRFYADGYTGSSGGWLQERIDLRNYAGKKFLLRFEVYTDSVSSYSGIAIDDLRIDAIDFHDGFESPDPAWIEEGWIRTDNRLPRQTWLQVVQVAADGLHLSRSLVKGSGDLTVDLLPDVSQALIAISPIVPLTSLESEYSLEVNLLDSTGAPMAVARECAVTTTNALNFRAVPNGEKIGLLPQGTAVLALNHNEGWFMVEYDGQYGWISGDYVTMRGDCE